MLKSLIIFMCAMMSNCESYPQNKCHVVKTEEACLLKNYKRILEPIANLHERDAIEEIAQAASDFRYEVNSCMHVYYSDQYLFDKVKAELFDYPHLIDPFKVQIIIEEINCCNGVYYLNKIDCTELIEPISKTQAIAFVQMYCGELLISLESEFFTEMGHSLVDLAFLDLMQELNNE